MEEKPPQRAGREAPRPRTPKAAFSTPEQPSPQSKPAERTPRRAARSAPPTVTFQPPEEGSEPVPQKKAAPRKAPGRQPADSDDGRKVAPPAKKAGPREPVTAPKAAQPAKTAEPAKAAEPVKAAEPAKATEPAKTPEPVNAREPAKATEPIEATEPVKAAKSAPAKKAARKATRTGAKAIPKATTPAQRKPATTTNETAGTAAEAANPAEAAPQAQAETAAEAPAEAAPQAQAGTAPEADDAEAAKAVAVRPTAALAEGDVTHPQSKPRTEAWAKIVADPGHAPELLALAAVQAIGPRAKEWARRTREEYPAATPDALARLAVAQFTRVGSVSSVFAALAGSYAPIALLGVNGYTYAELILHVAAAHGLDPADPRRAVDLLVLTELHPDAEEAEAALATARQPVYEEDSRLTDAVWRLGRMAATQAAAWMLLKGLNRFFPGTAVLAAIMTSRSGARNMGVRATRFYGGEDQQPA